MAELKRLLEKDHERLDALLAECRRAGVENASASYAEFRRGLLRHMGIEERVLFPFLRQQIGATPLEQQLHRDHAALAALLVPPPSRTEIGQITAILKVHNDLEEDGGGLYEIVEEIAGSNLASLISRVHAFPVIPVAPFSNTPRLRRIIAKLVREAEEGRKSFLFPDASSP